MTPIVTCIMSPLVQGMQKMWLYSVVMRVRRSYGLPNFTPEQAAAAALKPAFPVFAVC